MSPPNNQPNEHRVVGARLRDARLATGLTQAEVAKALGMSPPTLDALAIDQSAVIDPFAAIDRLGLTLNITKLDNLLGAVIPQGPGGVLITSERSPAIQRYTAAHEIGHWILHEHQLWMDRETEV